MSDTAPYHPVLAVHNVVASVADISFILHGGARSLPPASSSTTLALSTSPPPSYCLFPPSWLYNLFVSTFKDSIKSSIV